MLKNLNIKWKLLKKKYTIWNEKWDISTSPADSSTDFPDDFLQTFIAKNICKLQRNFQNIIVFSSEEASNWFPKYPSGPWNHKHRSNLIKGKQVELESLGISIRGGGVSWKGSGGGKRRGNDAIAF